MRTKSFLLGTATGAGLALASFAARRAFGTDPWVGTPLLALAGASAVLGWRAAEPGSSFPRMRALRSISPARGFAILAALAAIVPWIGTPAGQIVAMLGGSPGAAPLTLSIARMLTAAPFLVPAGWVLGSMARHGVAAVPHSAMGSAVAGAALAGMMVGGLGAMLLALLPQGAVLASAIVAGGLLTASFLARRWSSEEPDSDEVDEENEVEESRFGPFGGSVPAALAAGLAAATGPLLAPRILQFAIGPDLLGVPVARISFAGACVAGGLLAVVALPLRWGWRPARVASAAILGASILVAATWTHYDDLVSRFADWIAAKPTFEAWVANAFRVAGVQMGAVAALLGFAFVLLARDLPRSPSARPRWLAIVIASAFVGFLAGRVFLSRELPHARLEDALATISLITGVIAAAGIPGPGPRAWPRALGAFGGALALVLLARSAPPSDRDALLVDRNLIPASAIIPLAQKSWLEFDEDGRTASYAVVRRGHARRLLVDGRFEVSNESLKTQGFLAHLPILLHPGPRRVIVLGSGSGIALDAALSHPIERLECFEMERVPVRATARMGIEADRALRDSRVSIRLGDFEDLLARSSRADVILSQVSGVWGERAATVTTLEFLERVRSRLNDDGLYCLWVPDGTLTKDGIQILFATMARAFPQVEAWAGQGGDLLLLARRTKSPIDATRLVERFQSCNCLANTQRAWVEEPVTFLASFLASDATIRHIAGTTAVHQRSHPRLGREEAVRRRTSLPVNPVPGLSQLGDDVMRGVVAVPGEGFETAIRAALESKALEQQGFALEETDTFGALDVFQRAIAKNPHDGSVRRSLAMLRTRIGIRYASDQLLNAAHNNMRAAVETDTTYAQGFANLGHLLMSLGPPEYAIATTNQAILLEPDDDLAWVQLGTIHRGMGHFDEAIAAFEKAMTLNPRNVSAAAEWVDAKIESDPAPDLAGAVEFLEGYLQYEPENEALLYRIGKYRDLLRLGAGADASIPPTEPAAGNP